MRRRSWAGAPENELGIGVPLRVELAKTGELALAVADAIAYSTGFSFRLALRLRPEAQFDPRTFMMSMHTPGDEGQLRLGIEFADGRKATSGRRREHADEAPAIVLFPTGGGGGGGLAFDLRHWVYPVPPPGPLTFAVVWPARGIPETTQQADAGPIVEAAAKSDALWPDERPVGPRSPGFGSSTTAAIRLHPR